MGRIASILSAPMELATAYCSKRLHVPIPVARPDGPSGLLIRSKSFSRDFSLTRGEYGPSGLTDRG